MGNLTLVTVDIRESSAVFDMCFQVTNIHHKWLNAFPKKLRISSKWLEAMSIL